MPINLDDYYIAIQSVSTLPDADYEQWINSNKPRKGERKLKRLVIEGGSDVINKYRTCTTDVVDIPFLIEDGDRWRIQYGSARMFHFYYDMFNDLNATQKSFADTDVSMTDVKPELIEQREQSTVNEHFSVTEERKKKKKRNRDSELDYTEKKRQKLGGDAEIVQEIADGVVSAALNTGDISPKKKKKSRVSIQPESIIVKSELIEDIINKSDVVLDKQKSKKKHHHRDDDRNDCNVIEGHHIELDSGKEKKKSKRKHQ